MMLSKETPKNTMMRDENGNIREGVKWYLELNDILVRFFGNECGYSRGFQIRCIRICRIRIRLQV